MTLLSPSSAVVRHVASPGYTQLQLCVLQDEAISAVQAITYSSSTNNHSSTARHSTLQQPLCQPGSRSLIHTRSTHPYIPHCCSRAVPVGSRSPMTFPHTRTQGDAHITDVTVSGCPDNSHSGLSHTDTLAHARWCAGKAGRPPTTSSSAHQPWLVCVLLFYYATHPHAAQSNTPKAHTRMCQQTHPQQSVLACGLRNPTTQPTKFALQGGKLKQ